MTQALVTTRVEAGVGIMELSRPEKFNSLSTDVMRGIDAALTAFESDRNVRAILLRAQGKNFCTGADLAEVKSYRGNRDQVAHFIEYGHGVLKRLEASTLPVIGVVQGLALAGGLELMMACDVIFAAKSARMGDQHARYGLVPGWGGSQRLPQIVGVRRALDLLFSARWLSADEALAMGLVNYVCEDDTVQAEAYAYAKALTVKSRSGLAMMKRLARQGDDMALSNALNFEAALVVDAIRSEDVSEGLAAFEARREPIFP